MLLQADKIFFPVHESVSQQLVWLLFTSLLGVVVGGVYLFWYDRYPEQIAKNIVGPTENYQLIGLGNWVIL